MAVKIENGRYFPENAEIVEYMDGFLQFGLYESRNRPVLIGYKGKAKRPFVHVSYSDSEKRAQEVAAWVKIFERREAEKVLEKERKKAASKAAADKIQIGDIFSASWGYEQTNVDYYQVVGKRGQMVEVKEIGLRSVGPGYGPDSDMVAPAKDYFISDEVMSKRIQCYGDGGRPYIRIDSVRDAYLDDGKPQYRSWYH